MKYAYFKIAGLDFLKNGMLPNILKTNSAAL